MDKKKMAFYEIGKGRYASWMQEEFERAQDIVFKTGSTCKIVSTITIAPSDDNDSRFGAVGFDVKITLPPRKSMKYTTELQSGYIVSEGEDITEILQERLEFPDITAYNRKTGEVVSDGK